MFNVFTPNQKVDDPVSPILRFHTWKSVIYELFFFFYLQYVMIDENFILPQVIHPLRLLKTIIAVTMIIFVSDLPY